DTDLLGAARGLLGHDAGLIAILGTGANSGMYNGKSISNNVDSAGYLLGDEGSGAHLGKLILRTWLRKGFSKKTEQNFNQFCSLGRDAILNQISSSKYPNRFLAGFAPFAAANLDDQAIQSLVHSSFTDFFNNIIAVYEGYKNFPLDATGSVAYVFRDIFTQVANESGIEVRKITPSPMEGLLNFHLHQ